MKQIQERRGSGGGSWGGGGFRGRNSIISLRIARMAAGGLLVFLLLVNLFVFSWELRIVAALVAVTWIALTIAQILHIARIRQRFM